MVQKHDARRLHYDLRLEMDGVLKSWAVTRGPSLVPGEKRLSVHTEDHPLKYIDFEGVIPAGQYGGGTMIVWDQGRWIPEGDPRADYARGRLTFTLEGERLKGKWHLVRTRGKPGQKNEQWLLLKSDDEAARTSDDPDILEEETTSLKSGRTIEELAGQGEIRIDHAAREKVAKSGSARSRRPTKVDGAKKGILPAFVEPALAKLVESAPSGSNWLHEIKLDGYRMQARIDGGEVQLLTRKGLDWTAKFKPVANALKDLKLPSALLDGEIVVEDEAGVSSFSALQQELKGKGERFVYYVFDLLYLDGEDLRKADAGGPQGGIAAPVRRPAPGRRHSLQRPSRGGWRDARQACLPDGSGGDHLQARRSALQVGPRRGLGQVEVHSAPGTGDRRLLALDREQEGGRLTGHGCL